MNGSAHSAGQGVDELDQMQHLAKVRIVGLNPGFRSIVRPGSDGVSS